MLIATSTGTGIACPKTDDYLCCELVVRRVDISYNENKGVKRLHASRATSWAGKETIRVAGCTSRRGHWQQEQEGGKRRLLGFESGGCVKTFGCATQYQADTVVDSCPVFLPGAFRRVAKAHVWFLLLYRLCLILPPYVLVGGVSSL